MVVNGARGLLDLTIEGEKVLETRTPVSQFVEPGFYEGVSLHNLSVDFRKALTGLDLDVDVSSGEETQTDAVGETLKPGNLKVFCKYHLPTMVAELEIV